MRATRRGTGSARAATRCRSGGRVFFILFFLRAVSASRRRRFTDADLRFAHSLSNRSSSELGPAGPCPARRVRPVFWRSSFRIRAGACASPYSSLLSSKAPALPLYPLTQTQVTDRGNGTYRVSYSAGNEPQYRGGATIYEVSVTVNGGAPPGGVELVCLRCLLFTTEISLLSVSTSPLSCVPACLQPTSMARRSSTWSSPRSRRRRAARCAPALHAYSGRLTHAL